MQNLFEILGMEPAFSLNLKQLEQAYFTAQRVTHPDRFIGKPEADRVAAISRSQQVNDAYETLKDPLQRAVHLLELQGIEPLAENQKAVSHVILLEMMELRERVTDSSDAGAALAEVVEEIKAKAAANAKLLEEAFAAKDYDAASYETIRMQYLGKAMEDAVARIYRYKALTNG